MYVHCVYFTCKADTPIEQIDQLAGDAYTLLARIPTVRTIQSGRRDVEAVREVNDKEFHVGLMVCFYDAQGHGVYQNHAIHQEFIARHRPIWAKVRVFDFVTE